MQITWDIGFKIFIVIYSLGSAIFLFYLKRNYTVKDRNELDEKKRANDLERELQGISKDLIKIQSSVQHCKKSEDFLEIHKELGAMSSRVTLHEEKLRSFLEDVKDIKALLFMQEKTLVKHNTIIEALQERLKELCTKVEE